MMNKKMILAAWLLGTALCTTGAPAGKPTRTDHPGAEMAADPRDGSVQWAQTRYYPETGLYVTPIRFSLQDESKSEVLYKYLVSDKPAQEGLNTGYYLYLQVNTATSDPELLKLLPLELPAGFFAGKETLSGLSGAVLRYSVRYILESGQLFEKGENQKGKPRLVAQVENGYVGIDDPLFLEKAAIKCTSYYLMVTDENGQIIFVTYLYTSCVEEEPGGGGGGFTPTDENCNEQFNQLRDFAAATQGITDAQPVAWTEMQQTRETRTRTYDWIPVRNPAGFCLVSTLIGVQKWVPTKSPDLPDWEWVSLRQHALVKYGNTIGGTIDYSATEMASIGQYWAAIELKTTIKWHLICSWMPVLNSIIPDSHLTSSIKIHVDDEPTNEY